MRVKSFLSLTLTLFSILCFAQDFLYQAQQQNQECDNATTNTIQLIQFDTGPFVQGGNVAVFFDPQGIYEIDNFFILELSDETGDFTTPTVLSQKEEFFLPVMNGVIPSTTTVGTSYKLRVRSTNPAVELIIPNSFEVIEDSSFNLQPGSVDFIENSFTNTTSFIKCVDLPNGDYFFGKLDNGINAETPSANPIELQLIGGSDVDTQIRILSQGIWQNLPINFGQFAIPGSLPVGYYPIEIKRTFNSGTVNEYHLISGFIFLFNTGNTGIGNTSAEEVCVGEIVEFQVQSDLISSNYPGSLYSIDYGDSPDGTNIEYYTHARFQICNQLNHIYDTATCSSEWQDLNSGDYFYKLDFKLLNKGIFDSNSNSNEPIYQCNEYSENGNGTTKWINVSLQPTVDFTTQEIICAGTPIVATDTSISGAFGLGSSCETDYDRIWKIKRPDASSFTTVSSSNPFFDGWVDDLNGTLTIPASETSAFPGCYSVRLVINNPEGCIVEDTMTKIVVIEPAPISSFNYTPTVDLCAPITIEFTNSSNTENFSDTCGNPLYTWTVTADTSTPATSDGFGIIDADENDSIDAQNQTDVDIIFTQPGTYVVNLLVENTCGTNDFSQEIVIIGDPTVEFNPNVFQACQESPANYTLDFSEPNIAPTYSTAPFTPTSYFWEVFDADGVTPATNYSFLDVNGSTSDYPQINFTEFGTYVIKVSVDGNCGSSSFDTLQFSLKQTPLITNTDIAQAICSGDDTQEVVFTSDMNTTTYSIEIIADPSVGGYDSSLNSGTGIPVMTLTNSSNNVSTLTYTVTPSVENCDGIPLAFVYTVNPTPVIPNQTTAICSEETFVINPTNAPPNTIVPSGTTYVWTVADNINVTGEISETSPQTEISQQLINTTNTVQTVIYTVIPTSGTDGLCVGAEFTVTVDVNPKPVVADQTLEVCSDEALGYTIVGDVDTPLVATYNLTSIVNNGLVGDSGNQVVANGLLSDALTADVWTNETSSNVDVVYTLVPIGDNGCEGDPFTVTVTVNPEPVVVDQTLEVCSDEALGYAIVGDVDTPAVATYNLTSIVNNGLVGDSGNQVVANGLLSDALTADVWTNETSSNVDVVYTLVPIGDNGCEGNPFTVTVTVNPEPVVADQTLVVCSDEALGYTIVGDVDTPLVATYNLTSIVNNGLVGDSGNQVVANGLLSDALTADVWTNETSSNVDVVYTLVPFTSAGCEGDPFTVTVTVSPEPVVADQTVEVCSDEALGIEFGSSSSVTATSYEITALTLNGLTVSSGGAGLGGGLSATDLSDDAFTNETSLPVDVVYTVVPSTSAGCEGDPFTVTVTVNPEPVVVDQTLEVCSDEALGYAIVGDVDTPAVATYNLTSIVNNGLVGDSGNQVVANGLLSDALTADVWTNETSSNVDVVYTLVPIGDNGCEGNPFTVTVTVNPEPVVADQTLVVCSDEALGYTIVGDVDTPLVATYNLTSIVNNGLVGDSGNQVVANGLLSDALTADVWTNETSSNVDVVYTLVPFTSAGCEGDPFTVTVTVSPEPVVADQTVEVCSDEALGIEFGSSSSVTATSYEITALTLNGLTVSSGGAGLGGGLSATDLSDDAFTNETSLPVDVVYTVVPSTSAGCEGDPFTVTVTVNPEPVVVDQTLEVCSDEALGYAIVGDVDTPAVATYNLTSIVNNGLVGDSGNQVVANGLLSDALTADVWTNETSSNVDVVYTLVPIGDNGCEGNPFTVTVTVNPEPVVADQTLVVCSDEALGYTIVGDVDTPLVATYNLTSIVNNGLVGDSGNQVVANGLLSDALTADVWTNETSSNVDVVYTLVPFTSAGCEGDPFTVTVTVSPEPVVADQTVEVCSDEALGIEFGSSSSVTATSYEITALTLNGLTVSSGGAGLGGGLSATDLSDDAFTNETSLPVDVVYTVVPSTSAGCEGDPFTVTVTVNPEPVVVDQTLEVCSDEALGYAIVGDVDTPAVATYNLTSIVNNGLVGDSGNQVVANGLLSDALTADVWTNETSSNVDVVYTLVPIGDNGCEGNPFTVTVTVNPEPVGISSIETIISNVPFDFNLQNYISNAVISDFSWFVTSITGDVSGVNVGDFFNGDVSGIIENVSGSTAYVEYTISSVSNSLGCFGNPFTLTLKIDSEPVVADQTVEVCSDEALGIEFGSSSSVTATSYEITALTLNGLTVSSGGAGLGGGLSATDLSDDAFTNETSLPVDVVYTVVPFNNVTPGNPFTVTVTVNPEPVVVDQTLEVCSDEALGYAIVGDVDTPAVATYNLTSIVNNGLVGDSGNQVVANGLLSDALTADVWTNETSSNVDVVYTLVPIGDNGCEGNPFTVTVTVNPEPVVADQTLVVCSDEALGYTIVGDVDTPLVATYNLTSIVNNGLVGDSGNQVVANGLLSDALTADVWTNETSSNVDVVYTLVPFTSAGCEGDPFTVTVTVSPEPVVADQTVEVCSDEALGIEFGSSSSVTATSYEITALTLNGLTVSSGGAGLGGGLSATDLSDDAFTNETSLPVDVVYTVVPSTSAGCEGDPFTVTVTVNPEPVVVDQTLEVCSDEALGYAIVGDVDTPAVATYNLTSIVNNGLVGDSGNQVVANGLLSDALTADVWTNETSSNVDVVYTLVPIGDNGCEGNPFTVTVTVNPEPVVADQTLVVCSDEALGYTIVGDVDTPLVATYNLTSIVNNGLVGDSGNQVVANGLLSDALTADVWTNETSSNVDVVYTLVPFTSAGCEGDPFTVTVTVSPEPVVADQTVEVCSDEALGIEFGSSSSVTATSYEITALTLNGLTVSSGGAGLGGGLSATDLSDDAFTNETSLPVDVVYTVVPSTSAGCEGDPFTVTVTVNPEPVVVDQTLEVCSDEALGYAIVGDVDTPAVAIYNLTSIVNNGLVGDSGNQVVANGLLSDALTADVWTNETSSNVDVVYTLVPIGDNGCEGNPFTVTVTVNPEPVVADQTLVVCSDEALGYTIVGDVDTPLVATYNLTSIVNNGLVGDSGNQVVANGLLSDALTADVWTNETSSNVDVVYTLVPFTSAGCEGDPFTVTVTVSPEPVVADQTVEVCSDEALGIEFGSSSSVTATSYEITALTLNGLTVSSGGAGLGGGLSATDLSDDAFTNETSLPVDVVYTVVPSTSAGCEGDPFTVTVTVNPEPVVVDQTLEVCSDEALGYAIVGDVDTPAVATYNLTSIVNNGLVGDSGNQVVANGLLSDALTADVWTNETSSNVDVVYTLVPIGDNGCEGNPFTVTVTVNPEPVVADQTLVVCSDEALGYTIVGDVDTPLVATYNLTSIVNNGLVGDSGNQVVANGLLSDALTADVWTNETSSNVDVVYTLVPIGDNGCEGNPFTVTVTVNPISEIYSIANQTICSQSAFQDVLVTSPTQPTASITYTWEVTSAGPNLSGYTVSSGPIAITSPILGETIFNASNTAEDLIYTLIPYYDNCEGTAQTFTITVEPTPELPDLNTSICSEETFDVLPENGLPTLGTIVPVNTTYTWTVLPNPNVTGQSDEIQSQNNISQTLINLTNVAQDVVYIVTPTSADGCEGATFELTVTVDARPIIEDKIASACSGDTFLVEPIDNSPLEIVPSNTLYTWVILPGADLIDLTGYSDQTTGVSSISQTLINLTDESKTIVYEVTPISGTCEGLPFEIEVTVSPRPFVDDIIITPICSEDTFIVIPETAVPSPNNIVPIGTTFTWTVVDNPNVIGDTDEVNPQSQISQTLTNTSSTTQTVVYTVVPSSSGCDGPTFTITVDVKPRPFIVSGPDTQDTQCSGDPFVISPEDGVPTTATLVPVGTQYTWTTLGNPNLLGWSDQTLPVGIITQTLENTTNQIQQIIYTIIPEADGCVGPSFDAVITIEPKPFVPDVIVDICDATSSSNSSYILVPQNGVLPDASTIIPEITTYTWGPPIVTGGITGGSTGNDEAFFDSGILENLTTTLQTAIYTVTPNYYTVSNPTTPQCTGESFTITITVSPSPEINEVITNIACSYSDPLCGASIEISPVGIGPFTYSWVSIEGNPLNDPTDEDQFDLCPGTYELTITDASSCSYVFEYEIVPPEPVEFTLITQTDISCNNVNTLPCDGSIEASTTGGTLPYNLVEWYTETIPGSGVFDSGPLINIINPYNLVNACEGNYVLKILDANGCEFVSDVYTIEQAVEPIILTETLSNYNGFNIDCNAANSGTITVDLSGGSGVFIYSFVDAIGNVLEADTILSSPATLVFDFLIAGDYTLTVEDPNCTDQIVRNYTLTQPDELIITATLVDPVSCFGGLATYNVTATGGVPPYTGTGLQSVLSGPVTFIVSDANGCEDDFSTVVNEPTELLATYVVDDAPCFGDTGQITVTPTGGTGVLTVNLYDNNNILITSLNTTQGNSVIFDQLAATYFYDVVDQNNCSYGPEVVVVDEPDPIVILDFEVVQPDCNTVPAWEFNNGSICITITGGTNPFPIGTGWVDNGGGQWCLNNLSAGTYAIDVTDSNNCSLQNPFPDITLVRPPEITAVLTNTIDIDCDTDTATQINTIIVNGGVPPYQVTWSGGIVDAANPFVMETSVPGNYSAFVNDQYGIINGCPPIEFPLDPITFFEFGIADFTLSSDNSAFCGIYAINDPIQFNNISSGDIVSYNWNFGDGSPEFNGPNAPDHIYNAIGTYTISLTVEDLYGCFDTYSETIEITKGYEIILPNAFTPNGDGVNETIRPVTVCMTEIKLSIYDTWGSLIYAETGDDIYGWDGTIDGKPAENGNYIMVVIATTYNGAVIELNGPVTLIK